MSYWILLAFVLIMLLIIGGGIIVLKAYEYGKEK